LLRLAWIVLLLASVGLLYAESRSAIPFTLGALLLPVGLGCAGLMWFHFPVTRRPTVIAGMVLLVIGLNGFMLIVLGIQNADAFSNRQGMFIVLAIVVALLTIGITFFGVWLVRRVTLLASWPLLLCWTALVCIEVGTLDLIALIRPMESQEKSYQG
jgi:hypothetical protein